MSVIKQAIYFLLLLSVFSCADSEYYKVQFDNVDRLSEGDDVLINGLEVGQVKELELKGNIILARIWVGRNIKLPEKSIFYIATDNYGFRHIEIELSDSKQLMNPNELQKGLIMPKDSVEERAFTEYERDSLIKNDPVFRLADTVFHMLRNSKLFDSTRKNK